MFLYYMFLLYSGFYLTNVLVARAPLKCLHFVLFMFIYVEPGDSYWYGGVFSVFYREFFFEFEPIAFGFFSSIRYVFFSFSCFIFLHAYRDKYRLRRFIFVCPLRFIRCRSKVTTLSVKTTT